MPVGIVTIDCDECSGRRGRWVVQRANRQLGLSGYDGTAALDASAANLSADGDRDSSEFFVVVATGRSSAASRVAVPPPPLRIFVRPGQVEGMGPLFSVFYMKLICIFTCSGSAA